MNALVLAWRFEILKARRSRGPWISALGFSLAPVTAGVFMLILKYPDWAKRAGVISAKAQITAGVADWQTFLGVLAQTIAIGGFLIFGMILIWIFGREHADQTARDFLALPTPREAIVIAKFVVGAVWSGALAAFVLALGLVIGFLVGLPGWDQNTLIEGSLVLAACAVLVILLVMPLGWAASAGRGYLPAVGLMFLLVFFAQVIAALGWGALFPWSVPALLSGAAGPAETTLPVVSYILVLFVGAAGMIGTIVWWRLADHV